MFSRLTIVFGLASVLMLLPSISAGAVKSLSTDGETTIYLQGDFSRSFDITYNVVFAPSSANRSWSSVSVNLVETLRRSITRPSFLGVPPEPVLSEVEASE